MRTSTDLLREIGSVLPTVPKPAGSALSFHPADCMQCEFVHRDLEQYQDQFLPDEALRSLRGELTLLSAEGWRWVLPSYLARCVTQDPECDPMETEFLIYSLGPDPEYKDDAVSRLGHFTIPQLMLLLHFLEWCAEHPHWSEYCPEDIAKAQTFVSQLIEVRGAA
jgi:hypothetical protein